MLPFSVIALLSFYILAGFLIIVSFFAFAPDSEDAVAELFW